MRPTTTCLTESGGLQQGAEHGITTVEDAVRSVQAQHVGIGVKKLASEIKALFPYLDCTRKQVRAVLNNARQGGDRGPPSSHVPEDDSHLAPFVDDLFRDQGPITYEHLPGKGRRPPPLQPPPQQQQQQQPWWADSTSTCWKGGELLGQALEFGFEECLQCRSEC